MEYVATISKALDRAEERALKKVIPYLQKVVKKITKENVNLDTNLMVNTFRIGMLTAYIYGRAAAIGKLRKSILKKFNFAEDSLDKLINKILKIDKEIISGLSNANIDKAMAYYFRPSQEALRFLEGYTIQLAKVFDKNLQEQITKLVRNTIKEGMSEKEAVKYLLDNTKEFAEHRIKTIVRTETTRAYNIGRLEESLNSEMVVGYEFDAVLDKRTSNICRARDGKFIPKSDMALLIANTPPLHPNCRSQLIEVTKYDELPRKIIPNEWDPKLLPRQRVYDKLVLEQILKAELEVLTFGDINWVIERIRAVDLKEKYNARELKRIAAFIDPDNPNGLPSVRVKKLPSDVAGRYNFREVTGKIEDIGIEVDSKTPDKLLTYIHESLHRQYISRYGNKLPNDIEEAITDFLAKYIYTRSFKNAPVFVTGYKEYPLKILLHTQGRGSTITIDEMANKLYTMRKKGASYSDFLDEIRLFYEGASLTDFDIERVYNVVRKRKSQIKQLVKTALQRLNVTQERIEDIHERITQSLRSIDDFKIFWKKDAPAPYYLSQALQYMFFKGGIK